MFALKTGLTVLAKSFNKFKCCSQEVDLVVAERIPEKDTFNIFMCRN